VESYQIYQVNSHCSWKSWNLLELHVSFSSPRGTTVLQSIEEDPHVRGWDSAFESNLTEYQATRAYAGQTDQHGE
jgi:hypothetical protein